jgi:hypothetical protein
VIERLHTTRDDEKLKMFRNALANSCASPKFYPETK